MHSRAYQRNSEPQPSLSTNSRIALAGEMLSTRSQVATRALADQETSIPAPVPARGDRGDLRYPLGRMPISELHSSTIASEKRLTRSQVATRARAGQANCPAAPVPPKRDLSDLRSPQGRLPFMQPVPHHRRQRAEENALESMRRNHRGPHRRCIPQPTSPNLGHQRSLSTNCRIARECESCRPDRK